ncbi:sensor histidine kinase [uncultured Polaribacter sp.]|uniref:sensor histidine kinase n=1 Tax=uncultured Polaribacter sp. TaxID=174711 RepID=UPI0026336926|nr:sensor histidine kinase [uncultured Polaribacter sp.]
MHAKLLKESDLKSNKEILNFISEEKRTYSSFYNKKTKEVYISYVDGLMVYDSLWTPKTIKYKNNAIYCKSITKTANGVIWVGTFKEGVLGIKNNTVVKHYTIKNGLTSNNISTIKAHKNKLWIVTENSIQKFDATTLQFKKLTKKEGVPSYDISGIEFIGNLVFFASNVGLFYLDKTKTFKTYNPDIYFNELQINEKDTPIKSAYTLDYTQNTIKIGFNVKGFSFHQNGKYKYRLKGINNNWSTTETGVSTVKYNSLSSGKYTFQVQPYIEGNQNEYNIEELTFTIKKAFWKTWWFILGSSMIVLGSVVLYFKRKIRNKEKERLVQLEKINLEKELISQNLTALRSQMNPHFIFNALNSIQDLVLKQDIDTSYDYIVLFAELIRNTLNYSNQDFIPIEKEIEFLNIYLQLEKLRFGDDFNYTISFDSAEALEIPSLLIQPFIENALIHGLMHQTGKKELSVVFNLTDEALQCIITDNGIGRKKSKEIKIRQDNHHESFALSSIKKRLKIFQKQYATKVGYVIEDLKKNNASQGTRVIVSMPFKKLF